MVGYLARYGRAEQGRGRVGTCGGGSARAVGAYAVEKIPACGADKAVHFWPVAGSLLLRRREALAHRRQPVRLRLGLGVGRGCSRGSGRRPRAGRHRHRGRRGRRREVRRARVFDGNSASAWRQGGRVGTWTRPAQGVGGGRVCCPARVHASPHHPSQLNVTRRPLRRRMSRWSGSDPAQAGGRAPACRSWLLP